MSIESSAQVDAIQAAIVALQAELEPVTKDKENPFFKSKYADLGSVVEATKTQRARHGLGVVQLPSFDGEHDLLTTRIVHVSGQWLQASMRLHLVKPDPQGQGSAITYARRYSYGGALGVVTEDDDDGNAASAPPARRQAKKAPPAQQQHRPVAAAPEPGQACPACHGSGVRTMASGHQVACPVCAGKTDNPTADGTPEDPFARRRAAANAALADVGITGDDRHTAVYTATDGATESTGKLTSEQLVQIRAYCDSLRTTGARR